ncbi:ISL3 family transposase, partial [Aeromonas caviae]
MHHIDFDSFWPGYDVSVHRRCTKQITLALEPRANHLPLCGKCHQPCPLIHDRRMRLVRDRDLFELRVRLQVPIRRVDCVDCGRVSEHIDWLPPSSRLTQRLQCW